MYGKTFIEKVRYTVIFENVYQFINMQVKSKGDIDMTLEEVRADGELQDKMSGEKYREITARVWVGGYIEYSIDDCTREEAEMLCEEYLREDLQKVYGDEDIDIEEIEIVGSKEY